MGFFPIYFQQRSPQIQRKIAQIQTSPFSLVWKMFPVVIGFYVGSFFMCSKPCLGFGAHSWFPMNTQTGQNPPIQPNDGKIEYHAIVNIYALECLQPTLVETTEMIQSRPKIPLFAISFNLSMPMRGHCHCSKWHAWSCNRIGSTESER